MDGIGLNSSGSGDSGGDRAEAPGGWTACGTMGGDLARDETSSLSRAPPDSSSPDSDPSVWDLTSEGGGGGRAIQIINMEFLFGEVCLFTYRRKAQEEAMAVRYAQDVEDR